MWCTLGGCSCGTVSATQKLVFYNHFKWAESMERQEVNALLLSLSYIQHYEYDFKISINQRCDDMWMEGLIIYCIYTHFVWFHLTTYSEFKLRPGWIHLVMRIGLFLVEIRSKCPKPVRFRFVPLFFHIYLFNCFDRNFLWGSNSVLTDRTVGDGNKLKREHRRNIGEVKTTDNKTPLYKTERH